MLFFVAASLSFGCAPKPAPAEPMDPKGNPQKMMPPDQPAEGRR